MDVGRSLGRLVGWKRRRVVGGSHWSFPFSSSSASLLCFPAPVQTPSLSPLRWARGGNPPLLLSAPKNPAESLRARPAMVKRGGARGRAGLPPPGSFPTLHRIEAAATGCPFLPGEKRKNSGSQPERPALGFLKGPRQVGHLPSWRARAWPLKGSRRGNQQPPRR